MVVWLYGVLCAGVDDAGGRDVGDGGEVVRSGATRGTQELNDVARSPVRGVGRVDRRVDSSLSAVQSQSGPQPLSRAGERGHTRQRSTHRRPPHYLRRSERVGIGPGRAVGERRQCKHAVSLKLTCASRPLRDLDEIDNTRCFAGQSRLQAHVRRSGVNQQVEISVFSDGPDGP